MPTALNGMSLNPEGFTVSKSKDIADVTVCLPKRLSAKALLITITGAPLMLSLRLLPVSIKPFTFALAPEYVNFRETKAFVGLFRRDIKI